jgi:hypothetical protein
MACGSNVTLGDTDNGAAHLREALPRFAVIGAPIDSSGTGR